MVVLLVGLAAGIARDAGRGRAVELLAVGAAVVCAYHVPFAVARWVAVATTAGYLLAEASLGRADGEGVWTTASLALATLGSVLAAAQLRLFLRRNAAGAGIPLTRSAAGDVIAEKLTGDRGLTPIDFELERARRHDQSLALALVHPDRIGAVAERLGGEAALEVGIAVAGAIGRSLRATDVALRHGATDFAVILPETGAAAARLVAERIRLEVAETTVAVAGSPPLELSVSIGIATHPDDATAEAELVDAARRALERASAVGGNRTMLHSVPVGAPAGWGLEPTFAPRHRL